MTNQDQTNSNNSIEDDRIDLQELFSFLWEGRKIIVITTTVCFLLIELTKAILLTFLNALPNKLNVKASRTVDLPEPFAPIISVVGFLLRSISVKVSPVDRKFLNLTL